MNSMVVPEFEVQPDTLGKLNHIGFVVNSIEAVADHLAKAIGSKWNGTVIHDPLQVVRVSFIAGTNPFTSAIELVEPAGPNSPVEAFLRRGGGLHHLCYEVDELEEQLKLNRSIGGVVVRRPLPAVAFDGRRIAWVLTKERLLLEFLEGPKQAL